MDYYKLSKTVTRDSKMDAEHVKQTLEIGKCLLGAQEGKWKSDLWKTFDLVVETTGNQEKGRV